jgi:F-type H+-transporting ATPase subunit c
LKHEGRPVERVLIAVTGRKLKQGKGCMTMLPLFAAADVIPNASLLGGNMHVGLAALGAAISVGLIGNAASTAVGRNPGAATKVLVQSILAIAFAEAIVFYTLFLVK